MSQQLFGRLQFVSQSSTMTLLPRNGHLYDSLKGGADAFRPTDRRTRACRFPLDSPERRGAALSQASCHRRSSTIGDIWRLPPCSPLSGLAGTNDLSHNCDCETGKATWGASL